MEMIRERKMTTYVLSIFWNLGIGLGIGILLGILVAILTEGYLGFEGFLGVVIYFGVMLCYAMNIYHLYFYYQLSNDINAVCKGDGMETESFLWAFVFFTITLGFYRVYWVYKIAKRLRANAPRYGFKISMTAKEMAALDLFSLGYVSAWELIKNMNRIAKIYNQSGLPQEVGGVQ